MTVSRDDIETKLREIQQVVDETAAGAKDLAKKASDAVKGTGDTKAKEEPKKEEPKKK